MSDVGYSNRPSSGLRDLPPKSPGIKRLLPNVSNKIKRGEVIN